MQQQRAPQRALTIGASAVILGAAVTFIAASRLNVLGIVLGAVAIIVGGILVGVGIATGKGVIKGNWRSMGRLSRWAFFVAVLSGITALVLVMVGLNHGYGVVSTYTYAVATSVMFVALFTQLVSQWYDRHHVARRSR